MFSTSLLCTHLHIVENISNVCCHDFSGELPLNMIQTQSTESTDGPATASDTPLSKTFPMVTLAQW